MIKTNEKKLLSDLQLSKAVILVVLFLLTIYYLSKGYVSSPDTGTFSGWADFLISFDFNFVRYYSSNEFVVPSYFYTIPTALIAVLKMIFGDTWKDIFFSFNLLLLCLSVFLAYKILRLLLLPPICCALATSMLLLSDAYLVWPRYILTDTIFSTSVLLVIFQLVSRFSSKTFDRPEFFATDVGVILIIGFLMLTRPTAAPYVISLLSVWILLFLGFERKYLTLRNVVVVSSGILLVAGIFSSTLYWAQIFTPLDVRQIGFLGEKYLEGMVVLGRPETWATPPQSWLDILKIYLLKVLHFWAPWAESYSFVHKLLNGLFWAFCAGAIVGWPFVKPCVQDSQRFYLKLLVITAVSVTAFHAATMVDFDWRYRYPLVLPILIGASCVYWQMFVRYCKPRIESLGKQTF